MDGFWNKLMKNKKSNTEKSKVTENLSPESRWLLTLNSVSDLINLLGNPNSAKINYELFDQKINSLIQILENEERSSQVRLCLQHVYLSGILAYLSSCPWSISDSVASAGIKLFTIVISESEEQWLQEPELINNINLFISRLYRSSANKLAEDYFAELLFTLCTRLRKKPLIIEKWIIVETEFNKKQKELQELQETQKSQKSQELQQLEELQQNQNHKLKKSTSKDSFENFLIFYILLEFIYQSGNIGDFSRTSLLYLIESATPGSFFENWILNGDLGTLMASGLGALYSQLSRNVTRAFSSLKDPTIVTFTTNKSNLNDFYSKFSKGNKLNRQAEMENLQNSKNAFKIYLLFWQDLLYHCESNFIYISMLSHFYFLFLQQLLYPSLIESSSDNISGSSLVSVITYVRTILETLECNDLTHILLSYILALEDPQLKILSQKSLNNDITPKLHLESPYLDLTPQLYTLGDLILTSFETASSEIISASLRLILILTKKYFPYTMTKLFNIQSLSNQNSHSDSNLDPQFDTDQNLPDEELIPVDLYLKEIKYFLSMTVHLTEHENYLKENADSRLYKGYLEDAQNYMVTQNFLPTSREASFFFSGNITSNNTPIINCYNGKATTRKINSKSCFTYPPISIQPMKLDPKDSLLTHLIGLLDCFFSNPVELNLILTEVLSSLASAPCLSPRGWLLYDLNTIKIKDISLLSDEEIPYEIDDQCSDISGDEDFFNGPPVANMPCNKEKASPLDSKFNASTENILEVPPIMRTMDKLKRELKEYKEKLPEFDLCYKQCFEAINLNYDSNEQESKLGNFRKFSLPAVLSSVFISPTVSLTSTTSFTTSTSPPKSGSKDYSGTTKVYTEDQNLDSNLFNSPKSGSSASIKSKKFFQNFTASPSSKGLKDFLEIPPEKKERYKSLFTDTNTIKKNPRGTSNNSIDFMKVQQISLITPRKVSTRTVSDTTFLINEIPKDSKGSDTTEDLENSVSISHLITNAIIYHEFAKELAAIIHMRARLFDSLSYD